MSFAEAYVENPEVVRRFPELHPPLDAQSSLVEANRCLFCFDAPCTIACPTHIDVPRFIKKISSANLRGSALTILDSNVLGASCARVCPVEVLCEGACVMHRYNKKPIEIGRLQRHAMEYFYSNGAQVPWKSAQERPQKIACVGAGPASLACAAELRRHGYQVTVFDAKPLPGGLNTYGVAEYKLRPSDSLREVEFIQSLGVNFQFGVSVGTTITFDQLEKEYNVIFLGIGLGACHTLGIPGEDIPDVADAIQFIADYKTGKAVAPGRRVVVVGAGNTAIDAANAAKRLGAEEVHIVYRRSQNQMSAYAFEYEHANQEGVQFHWWTQPIAIHADPGGGRMCAIECVRTQEAAVPIPVAGSNFQLPCDMLIRAIGQLPLLKTLEVVDRQTGRTSNPKYYAGGDCANGGKEVVHAVAEGKRAGAAIAKALEAQHG